MLEPDMSAPRVSNAAPASIITPRREVIGEMRMPLMCSLGSRVMFGKEMVWDLEVWGS